MKIVMYTLNVDGTIPEYIIDGGYLPSNNDKESPQDLNLIGLATDDAPNIGFANKEEVLEYVNQSNMTFIEPLTGEMISTESVVESIWNHLVAAITN